ncbi:hypothetical protein [Streptomyces sp. bgisy084]|uniref:hypothetical protein n=1 Tax=Streptomyces sp. bgisy084 TaxID=3413777 RepID=UPI003D72D093
MPVLRQHGGTRGRSATPATDVFALGNLAVFAATGRTAFGEGNPDALFYRILNEPPELDACPPALRTIVKRCLARDPAERPAVSEIMEYARKQTAGQTLALAGSWLPEAVERSLAGYDTRAYVPPPRTKKAGGLGATAPLTAETEKKGTAGGTAGDRAGAKTVDRAGAKTVGAAGGKPPAGGGGNSSGGSGSSSGGALAVIGLLAVVAFFAIGPDKVVGAISDGLKESPSPSSTYSTPSYTSSPDVNAQGTGLTGGSDTSTPEPTEEATPDGCARGNQVFSSNLGTYDKASAASLSSLASSLDSAASDAGDSEAASALRDLADDARALSDAASQFDAALNRRDSAQAETYKKAFSSARQEWEDDAETFKSVCS